jgi:DNA-binding transcriptional regulator YdaS (Cro superfamily)
MDLKEYFDGQPYGAKATMARRLGITKTWMSLLISGRQKCGPELAVEIEKATGGAVTRESLRPDLFGNGAKNEVVQASD